MPLTDEEREQYRQWLLDRDLPPDVAGGILETMPPFDWTEIARRTDLAALESRLDGRIDALESRLDGRLDSVDGRLDSVDVRLVNLQESVDGVRESVGDLRLAMGDFRESAGDSRESVGDLRLSVGDLRVSIGDRFEQLHERVGRVEDGLVNVGLRLDTLNQTFTFFGAGIIVTLILGFSAMFTGLIMSL